MAPDTAATKPPCPMHGCKIPEHQPPSTAAPPICERCSGVDTTVRHWGPRCARCGCDEEHEHDD